ncbi:hypothetical protein PEC301653_00780 [Pectobacterium carotovorum subsp. carotovorum]|nr:hypothetical protein PEC301653_00780 [Pectobacterium carotovorum subsp. carotovorum]
MDECTLTGWHGGTTLISGLTVSMCFNFAYLEADGPRRLPGT